MKPFLAILVDIFFVWTTIGSLVWFVLAHVGAVGNAFDQKQGHVSMWFAGIATLRAILVWPKFAAIAWKRRREVLAQLKRVVWGMGR